MIERTDCSLCGTKDVAVRITTRDEPYEPQSLGLGGVQLVGVGIAKCPRCGEAETIYPAMGILLTCVAIAVLYDKRRLTNEERRFVRKAMGISRRLAELVLGTDDIDNHPDNPPPPRRRMFEFVRPDIGDPFWRLVTPDKNPSEPVRQRMTPEE